MFSHSKRVALLTVLFALAAGIAWHNAVADEDLVHVVSGVVKSVDKTTKTVVVKSADGTEHTIKYTDKTTVEAAKDAGKGSADTFLAGKEGAKVTVKYTEKGGEKTAVGIKDASKATAKTVAQ